MTSPPPPVSSANCFNQGPATITLTGIKPVNEVWDKRNALPAGSRINARGATWRKDAPAGGVANDMVRFGPGPNNCLHGGRVIGLWDKNTEAWETYHSSNAFVADGPNAVIEDVYAENFGDVVKFMGNVAIPDNWTVRRVHGKDIFDDCIENDWQTSGLIEDVLFEGCFTFVASRERLSFPSNGTNNTIRINKAIVWHKGIPSDGGNAGRFWKIDIVHDPVRSPKHIIINSIVRMDPGQEASRYCLNERNIVVQSTNNVLVWTGSDPFGPCGPAPAGWEVKTGQAGLDFWNAKVAEWKAGHPGL